MDINIDVRLDMNTFVDIRLNMDTYTNCFIKLEALHQNM